ncbi:MAG: HAMP domain-containing sensor histidine kinase [Spirochaetota bacterium]
MSEALYPWFRPRQYILLRYLLAVIGNAGLVVVGFILPQYRSLFAFYMAVSFAVAFIVIIPDIIFHIRRVRGYESGLVIFFGILDVISLTALDVATRIEFSITFSPIFLVLLVTLQGMFFFWRLLPNLAMRKAGPVLITSFFLVVLAAGDVFAALRFGNFSVPIIFLKVFTILTFHLFISYYYGMLIDTITAQLNENRSLNEKLIGAMKFIVSGEIFSVMLHDLKNMLHTIVMALEGVRMHANTPETGRYYPLIGKSIDDIEKIINQFLSYIRLDPQREERIDVRSTVREAVDFVLLSRSKTAQITFDCSGLEGGVIPVVTSKYRLLSVFLNIITNAVQSLNASQVTEKRIGVSVAHTADTAVIVINDNGPGISPDNIKRIFTVFSTKKEGLGLGLHFVHDYIVNTLGGDVTVASTPLDRTTFMIRLPLTPEEK